MQQASSLREGRQSKPILWSSLPIEVKGELVGAVNEEIIERIAVFLLPFLKQKTISTVLLEQFNKNYSHTKQTNPVRLGR